MPRQPEPTKTRLISSADTPKSDSTNTGSPRPIASKAAVEDTVTRPRAPASAVCIEPCANRIRFAGTAFESTRCANTVAYGQVSRWVCCSFGPARSFTTGLGSLARATRMASRSARCAGTFAWAANTRSEPAGGPGGEASGSSRNGSRASANASPGASLVPSAENSASSRRLCTTNRSQPARARTARAVAGTLIPGSPVSNSGRSARRSRGWSVRVATTGPVQASRSTSGRQRAIRTSSRRRVSTGTGPVPAARICAADGWTGLATITWARVQDAGNRARVATLHFR